ncbi:MAG: hypothetical protein QOD06_314 [Candidatus Binatota bacterium]|nr:hypothetical protein [Candidatus Binatota bacterium]
MSDDSSTGAPRRELEKRVESLASELATLINDSKDSDERDALKDLAVAIVRDEVKGREEEFHPRAVGPGGAGAFNAIGVAIPLALAGALMIFLFPPVGLVLFVLAGFLVVAGVGASLWTRR